MSGGIVAAACTYKVRLVLFLSLCMEIVSSTLHCNVFYRIFIITSIEDSDALHDRSMLCCQSRLESNQ